MGTGADEITQKISYKRRASYFVVKFLLMRMITTSGCVNCVIHPITDLNDSQIITQNVICQKNDSVVYPFSEQNKYFFDPRSMLRAACRDGNRKSIAFGNLMRSFISKKQRCCPVNSLQNEYFLRNVVTRLSKSFVQIAYLHVSVNLSNSNSHNLCPS